MDTVHRIHQLTREQCLDRLQTAEVGRVVFSDQALPAILPITFVVDGDCVVIRTSKGSRLARAAHGAVLALEADEVLVASRAGWSVVVTGEARIETDPAEQNRLDGMLQAWAPGLQDVFIRIPLQVVSGRQLQGIPMASVAVSPSYGRSAAVEPRAHRVAG